MRKTISRIILSVLFVLFSAFLMGGLVAQAATPTMATIKSSENLAVSAGAEFTTTVSLETEEPVAGFQLKFLYDQTKFTFVSITRSSALISNITVNATIPGEITLNYSDISNVLTGEVTLFDLAFLPDVNLGMGEHPLLWMDFGYDNEISTLEDNEMGAIDELYFHLPMVRVGMYGDVNGDGRVSIQDVGMIQLYLAGLVSFDENQLMLADVNMDGRVSIQDVGLIQLYLAGLRSYLGPDPSIQKFTVTFDTGDGTPVSSVQVLVDQLVPVPDDPTREGYAFHGWFMDAGRTEPFDFGQPITKSTTLYAKWVPIGESTSLTIGYPFLGIESFFGTYWGHRGINSDVTKLTTGYNTVTLQKDKFEVNPMVVKELSMYDQPNGDRTYTIEIHQDLVWNNGQPITAKDYVFTLLLSINPMFANIVGLNLAIDVSIIGAWPYSQLDSNSNGLAEHSGVQLINDYTFSISINGQQLPFYDDFIFYNVAPTPSHHLLPLGDVVQGINGAKLVSANLEQELRSTIDENGQGYRYDIAVTAGPYNFVKYDPYNEVIELVKNPLFKGNFEGQKAQIDRLVLKWVPTENQLTALMNKEIDLVPHIGNTYSVSEGLYHVSQGIYSATSFARNGYGLIAFHSDEPVGPTSSAAVRQAIALLIDRQAFNDEYTDGRGYLPHADYSRDQWMTQASMDENGVVYGRDADGHLVPLHTYEFNPQLAVQLLEADGWIWGNAEGTVAFDAATHTVRYKTFTEGFWAGQTIPLHINWANTPNNPVSNLIRAQLLPNAAAVGMTFSDNTVDFNTLLHQNYYGANGDGYLSPEQDEDGNWIIPEYQKKDAEGNIIEPDVRENSMFNLAAEHPLGRFTPYYGVSVQYWGWDGGANVSYIYDEEMLDAAYRMMTTDNDEDYLYAWQQYQLRFNMLLPTLPLYSDMYYAFFTNNLKDYQVTAEWTWSDAILYASVEQGTSSEMTSQEVLEWTLESLQGVIWDGKTIEGFQFFPKYVDIGGVERATFAWQSSHPHILDTFGVFNAPEQDTWIELTVTILVDGTLEVTKTYQVLAKALTEMITITFDTMGGDLIDPITIYPGYAVPYVIPEKEGFTFQGWYADVDLTQDVYYWTSLYNDTTLYANWFVDDDNYALFVTGQFAEWRNALGNPDYLMQPIDMNDPRLEEIYVQLMGADKVFIKEITLSSRTSGWGREFLIDGSFVWFDENLSIKVLKANEDNHLLRYWMPSPESGPVLNLTPDTLWISDYVSWEGETHFGNSNDAMYAHASGAYYVVYADFDGQHAIGLIPRTIDAQEIMDMLLSGLGNMDGRQFSSSYSLSKSLVIDGDIRATIEWVSSNPEVFDENGNYFSVTEDTVVTLTFTIIVDNTLQETRSVDIIVIALENYYTIQFNSMGGQVLLSESFFEGKPIWLPTPYKTDHIFAGWHMDEECNIPFDMPTMPGYNFTLYAKWISSEQLTIEVIKTLPLNQDVNFEGVVTNVTQLGFYVEDETGSIFIYTGQGLVYDFVPGALLEIQGVITSFFGMNQIQDSSWNVMQPAPELGYDYSAVPQAPIGDLMNHPSMDPDFYAEMFVVEGYLSEGYINSQGVYISGFTLTHPYSFESISLHTRMSIEASDELYNYLDRYVQMVVVVYHYHTTHNIWAFHPVAGTIVELTEIPEPTQEQIIFGFVRYLENDYLTSFSAIDSSISLMPSISNVDYNVHATIVWESSHPDIIGHDGTYYAPEEDKLVTLTARLFMNEEEVAVVSGDVWVLRQIEYVTITLHEENGQEPVVWYFEEGNYIWLPTPFNPGYEFLGWFMDVDHLTPFTMTQMPNYDFDLYAKWEAVPENTTLYIKTYFDGTPVEFTSVVSHVVGNGFFLHDETGGLFVYTGYWMEWLQPGSTVLVEGTKTTFWGMPQIANDPAVTLINQAPAEGFDYGVATPATIEELNNQSISNLSHFGQMRVVEGYVTEFYYTDFGLGANVAIMNPVTGEHLALHLYISSASELELIDAIGEYVRLVVITYDYWFAREVWRFHSVEGTLDVLDAPILTVEEWLIVLQRELEQTTLWDYVEIYSSILLPTVLPTYDNLFATVTWTSSHPDIIDSNGNFFDPSADTVVTLTATLTYQGSVATFERIVIAKAAYEWTLEDAREYYQMWATNMFNQYQEFVHPDYTNALLQLYNEFMSASELAKSVDELQEMVSWYIDELDNTIEIDIEARDFYNFKQYVWYLYGYVHQFAIGVNMHNYYSVFMTHEQDFFSALDMYTLENVFGEFFMDLLNVVDTHTPEQVEEIRDWANQEYLWIVKELEYWSTYDGRIDYDLAYDLQEIQNSSTYLDIIIAVINTKGLIHMVTVQLEIEIVTMEVTDLYDAMYGDLSEENQVLLTAKLQDVLNRMKNALMYGYIYDLYHEFMHYGFSLESTSPPVF